MKFEYVYCLCIDFSLFPSSVYIRYNHCICRELEEVWPVSEECRFVLGALISHPPCVCLCPKLPGPLCLGTFPHPLPPPCPSPSRAYVNTPNTHPHHGQGQSFLCRRTQRRVLGISCLEIRH